MSGPRKGRVEVALDSDLKDHKGIGPAEKAALRAQARAVDEAEHAHEPELVSRANAVYLDLRRSAGLVGGGQQEDSFAQLLAELSRPSPALGHPEKP